MLALLLVHAAAYAVAPALVRAMGRRAFWLLALPSAATAVWALGQHPGADPAPARSWEWIPSIGLAVDLRMDVLSWVMTLVVSVLGVLVLVYCAGYFDNDEDDLPRFAAHLAAFAGVMCGLVWSDNLLLLYLFWELTSVLSYLLVGHLNHREEARQAATQALVVTTAGGLAMLGGLVLLGRAAGTHSLHELVAQPPQANATVAVALVLVLVGAVSKSALVPFHFWLPGAMAAPTPVSAYLHAAAMVKAGVYLVARLAPGFADRPEWLVTVLGLGAATMLIGGYRALRQHDLKLLLAYGTVSQLGFLVILFGLGTRAGALAGLAMLVSHAVFKAALFLSVGAVDHATGTRDLRRLHLVGRRMPVLATASTLAALSMAGVPPMLGFVGKEAAYGALWHGTAWWSRWVLAVVVAGSVLTFAYAGRFVLGTWGPARAGDVRDGGAAVPDPAGWNGPMSVHANRPAVTAVPVLLGVLCLVLAFPSAAAEAWVMPWVESHPAGGEVGHLGLWHGLTPVLGLSLATLAAGLVLVLLRGPVESAQRVLPHATTAVTVYRKLMRGLDRLSLELTGALYKGSLTLALGLILMVLVVVPGAAVVRSAVATGRGPHPGVLAFETPAQLAVAVVTALAAAAAVASINRFRAVFLVGVTGYACALLFLLHGAPDLALTQLLVESVSLVVFVLVLRRFPSRFADVLSTRARAWRIALAVGVGTVVSGAAMVTSMARTAEPDSVTMPRSAVEFGGGHNVVNVILVDTRAWDTMGELSVVLVAATGVASLVYLRSTNMRRLTRNLAAARAKRPAPQRSTADVGWLAESDSVPPSRRSLLLEVVVRLVFHVTMVWSVFLLLTGHNHPGGGFAAGLVAGLALTLRYLAGGPAELRVAVPIMPGVLLGSGLFLSAGSGLFSMLVGGDVLQSWTLDIPVPLIGHIHLVTSMFFDVGVYLVVLGLMVDLLRSLGSTLDHRMADADDRPVEESRYEPIGERR